MVGKRHKSRGFSLVEVLVGVMILGLVVSPLLHTMVTAMGTARKGRVAQNLNVLSRNLTETVNTQALSALLDGQNDAFGAAGKQFYKRGDGRYTALTDDEAVGSDHFYIGLTDLTYPGGSTEYDAMIELNATEYDNNDEAVSIYTAMDSIFTQPASASENPDVQAAEYFADQAFELSIGGEYADKEFVNLPDASDFFFRKNGAEMDRQIIITQDARTGVDAETKNINGSVVYRYSASCTVNYLNGETLQSAALTLDGYATEAMEFSLGDEQSNTAPKAFYFFFYPNFGGDDLIDFQRGDTLPLRAFLVRQLPPLYFLPDTEQNQAKWTDSVNAALGTYRPTVQLREPFDPAAGLRPRAELYLNFGTADGGSKYRFVTVHDRISVFRGFFPAEDGLVVQEEKDRLYQVTVTLYTAGEDFSDSAKLTVLSSTVVK